MRTLNNNELKEINGGGVGLWLFIGGVFVFLVGVVDGYVRPLACHN